VAKNGVRQGHGGGGGGSDSNDIVVVVVVVVGSRTLAGAKTNSSIDLSSA